MVRRLYLIIAVCLLATACSALQKDVVIVGAVYPTGGGQGPGGIEELRGLQLAAELANDRGGVDGRSVQIRVEPADSAEGAPGAVARLAEGGAKVIAGSYGSTISAPAAAEASRLGIPFWETGAVGELMPGSAAGHLVFRFAPTGASLGRTAVAFVRDQLAPRLPEANGFRYGVAFVDDPYGRAVGLGALDEIRRSGLSLAGSFPYDLAHVDYDVLARKIGESGVDFLVVVAYLEDGVDLRRAMVRARVPLVASIGTSSSYCHPAFGLALGNEAVGLFASDKPDGDVLDPRGLTPEASELLRWARDEYRRRFGGPMEAPALSGLAAGWALFAHVLPRAPDLTAEAISNAVLAIRLPEGSLPNGSGLQFAPAGAPDAGANLRAVSVIWEWVRPNVREVVWPPAFATGPIVLLPIS